MQSNKKQTIFTITTLIGLLDSIYLMWIKFANQEALCAGIGECDVVNSSKYAEINGIPIALIGAGGYLAILLVHFYKDKSSFLEENGLFLLFGFTLIGMLYSIYLTYIEIAVLQAICPFCVISAIAILILFIITLLDLKIYFSNS